MSSFSGSWIQLNAGASSFREKRKQMMDGLRYNNVVHVKSSAYWPEEERMRVSQDAGHTLLQDITVVWRTLWLTGMAPLRLSRSGRVTFRLCSFAMLYSLAVYLLLMTASLFCLREVIRAYSSSIGSFYDSVYRALQMVCLIGPLSIAPLHWTQAPCLQQYLENWRDFQIKFHSVTNKKLEFSLRTRARGVLIVVFTATIFHVCNAFLVSSAFNYYTLPYYVYSLFNGMVHQAMWHLLCQGLVRSAKSILQEISVAEDLTPEQVRQYCSLWLQLAALTEGTADSLAFVMSKLLLCMFIGLTMATYAAIHGLVHGPFSVMATFLSFALLNVVTLNIFCGSAEAATNEVGDKFHMKLRLLSSKDEKTQLELQEFLHTVATNKPAMSLQGFVVARKKLITTLLSAIASYLIVLVQFEGSDQTDESTGEAN